MARGMRWSMATFLAISLFRVATAAAWTSSDLARGPIAILNAPLVPFRSAAGGVQAALGDTQAGLQRRIMLPPTLGLAGGAMGLVEGVIWLGTGLADTLTGGALAISTEEATHLSAAPLAPMFLPNARQPRAAASH
jgi:hypothetical protein